MKDANAEKILEILNSFDFRRVHKAMRALHWRYGYGKDSYCPDETELRETATRLLLELVEIDEKTPRSERGEFYMRGTGGFNATLYYDKATRNPILSLYFAVEEYDAV